LTPFSNDNELLIALRNGDSHAFEEIYGLYFKPLCYFAEKITSDGMAAEDMATESFVKLLQKKPEFETLNHLKSYLYTTTRNGCLDLLRMKKSHDHVHSDMLYMASISEEETERAIIMAEVLQAVYNAIEKLPAKYKGIVKLALVEGKDNEEIAVETGMAYQTIRNQKSEGIKLLRLAIFKDPDLSPTAIICCLLYLSKWL